MKKLPATTVLQSETAVGDYLPYSHHVTPAIIATKKGEYLSTWRIRGRSHECASQEDVFNWVRDLNYVLRGIATANLSLWSHVVRRKVQGYPESTFANPFCKRLDTRYRERLRKVSPMVNELYLTVIVRPTADEVLGWFARLDRETLEEKRERQAACVKTLEEANRSIGEALRPYEAQLLGMYEAPNGRVYSSVLEFLAFLVNGEWTPMPVCRSRFADYMALNRVFFSTWGELGEIRLPNGRRYFGMLEIAEYDAQTEPGMLNALLEARDELIVTNSFSALSRSAAKGVLQRAKQHLEDAQDLARDQIEEIDEALNQLMSGEFVMGEHHGTVTVFGESGEGVRQALARARDAMLDAGLVPKVVDLALEAGYWAQLPANWEYRPRPAPITSRNWLCFSPFHNFLSGKPTRNPWGPAAAVLKTVSGTPFFFNFHVSPMSEDATEKRLLGHTLILGQSSAGKTVLLCFLLAQAQKFRPTVVCFDKDRGMEIAIRAMGGRYLPLRSGEPSGFNPFQLEPTPANVLWLKQFVKTLAGVGGERVTHTDEEEIGAAVDILMMHIDRAERRLSTLLHSLPNPMAVEREAHPTVHARLAKWCEGGQYGWLFDNPTDVLDLSRHQMFGFDVTEFLETPDTRGALMMYLVFRTEAMIDGRRFMYVFDEFWKALDDEYFRDLVRNKLKTIRKQNGICVFATQEPADGLKSEIASTLVQQLATLIALPNPRADRGDYIDGLKLTPAEFEIVQGLPEASRRFLVKQGDSATVAELNLSGMDDELLVLSGTPDNARLVEQVFSEVGENPEAWLPVFVARARARRRAA